MLGMAHIHEKGQMLERNGVSEWSVSATSERSGAATSVQLGVSCGCLPLRLSGLARYGTRVDTRSSLCNDCGAANVQNNVRRGIHGSLQIPTDFSSPMRHLNLASTRSQDDNIVKETNPLLHPRQTHVENSQAFKTLLTKLVGFKNTLQSCFPSIALLKCTKSRNPIPPSFLEVHNLFQGCQWVFLLSPLYH
ncbi:UNVERIFIED_CONTAM: hypothetical protein Slati_2165500 [Sesamum latifolium]|uniref:Uncharacterized protein n=1 Tax=Sesamum latifolium TaxID=2727402 RepID=A0AAW2WSE9_9LAMI